MSMFDESGPFCGCHPIQRSDGSPVPAEMFNSGQCQEHPIGSREPTIRERGHYERTVAAAIIVPHADEPATRGEAVERLREIVRGIDCTEDHSDGWWETSTGAAFGASKLAELEALVRDLTEPGL